MSFKVNTKDFIALLLSLFLTLALGEIGVRMFEWAPKITPLEVNSPHGIFEYSDNAVLKYVPKKNSGDINSYGIRDSEYSIRKPDNTYRVVVLGDSVAFGFCNDEENLPLEAIFPKVLERGLNTQLDVESKRVEVINLAVSGYGTEQEVEFLKEKGLALGPDLVMVAYCLNDSFVASAELKAFQKHPMMALRKLNDLGHTLFAKSHLFRLVVYRAVILRKRIASLKSRVLVHFASKQDKSLTDAKPMDSVSLAFEKLKRLSESNGFDVLVAIFPLFEDYEDYSYLEEHADVRGKAEQYGLKTLDLLEAFQEGASGDFKSLQGRCNREHPNESGHQIAAKAIEEYFRKQPLAV